MWDIPNHGNIAYLCHYLLAGISKIITYAKFQSEWFILIWLQVEHPTTIKIMNKTWQLICPFQDQKTGNAAIPGLSCCSREVDVVTRIEILHSLQEQHNTTIKTLSEQQFLVTPGHKGSFKINRKKNPGARVCKAVQKERTCQCFHDSVI